MSEERGTVLGSWVSCKDRLPKYRCFCWAMRFKGSRHKRSIMRICLFYPEVKKFISLREKSELKATVWIEIPTPTSKRLNRDLLVGER